MHGVMQASPLVARTVRLDVRRRPVSILDAFPPALIRVALLRNGALGKRARRAIRAASRANVWRASGGESHGTRARLLPAVCRPLARTRASSDSAPGASAKSAAADSFLPRTFQSLPQAFTGSKVTARTTRAAGARAALKVRADAKNLTFDMKSRIKIQEGIDQLADAVAVTLGPRGASEPITVRRAPSAARDRPSRARVAAPRPPGSPRF